MKEHVAAYDAEPVPTLDATTPEPTMTTREMKTPDTNPDPENAEGTETHGGAEAPNNVAHPVDAASTTPDPENSEDAEPPRGLLARLAHKYRTIDKRELTIEVLRFLAVGGFAYVVDVVLCNILVYGFFGIPALMHDSPLKAKVVSTVVSMIVAWLGNRLWTYGDRQSGSNLRGIVLFVVVNLVGMIIAVGPLGITWYLLGLRDPISYNISTNIVGIGLAMIFRFYAYRTWVFKDHQDSTGPEVEVVVPLDREPGRG